MYFNTATGQLVIPYITGLQGENDPIDTSLCKQQCAVITVVWGNMCNEGVPLEQDLFNIPPSVLMFMQGKVCLKCTHQY